MIVNKYYGKNVIRIDRGIKVGVDVSIKIQ